MTSRTFSPRVETLDDRSLLSVTLTNGLLELVGSTGPDEVGISSPGPSLLRVTHDVSGTDELYDIDELSGVLIRVRAGNDLVAIDPELDFPVEVRGWAGDDEIYGGSGDDMLLGGGGHDWVQGGGGDDRIFGQHGPDDIFGEAGDDTVYGDFGVNNGLGDGDRIDGGDGDDNLFGGVGDDEVFGDDGFDTLTGGFGDDYLGGGYGDDDFILGLGTDDIDGGLGMDDYFTQDFDDADSTFFASDAGLYGFTEDYWGDVDFDAYTDPDADDYFGGYGEYWIDAFGTDPADVEGFEYLTDEYFDGLNYSPVRTIGDEFVLTADDATGYLTDLDDGYRLQLFDGGYADGADFSESDSGYARIAFETIAAPAL